MGKLQVSVVSAQLFHRAPLVTSAPNSLPVTHVELFCDQRATTRISCEAAGYMPQYNSVLLFDHVNWRSRIDVTVVMNKTVVGHCVVSLARIVNGRERKHWFTLATPEQNTSTVVAGYVQLGLLAQDVSQIPDTPEAPLTGDTAAQIMQTADYDELLPRLTKMLASHNPAALHTIDLILSEGPAGQQTADGLPLRPEQLLSQEHSVQQYYSVAIRNACASGYSGTTKTVAVEVKSGEQLAQDSSVSPKVIFTSATQEMMTHPANNTENPVYSGEERLFDVPCGESTIINITVVDHNPNGSETLLSTGTFQLASVSCGRTSTRTMPLLTPDGVYGGTITIDLFTEDFGDDMPIEQEAQLRDLYRRLTCFFVRYDPPRLAEVDAMAAQNYRCGEMLMDTLIQEYGLEPGTSTVKLRLDSVRNLMRQLRPLDAEELVVEISMPKNEFQSKTVRYIDGCALLAEEFALEVVRQTDVIVLSVLDDNRREIVYGTAHVSLAALQRGVKKRREYILVEKPGTNDALVAGTIEIELCSEFLGQSEPLDECYEEIYSRRLRQMLVQYYPERLHRMDVILSSVYDMERYLCELTPRHLLARGAPRQPSLRITPRSGKGLHEDCIAGAMVISRIGVETLEGPVGVTTNPQYPPALMELTPDYPEDDTLVVAVVLPTTGSTDIDINTDSDNIINTSARKNRYFRVERGRVEIPVRNLWRNRKQEREYPLFRGDVQCGEIILSIETIECGTENGQGAPLANPSEERARRAAAAAAAAAAAKAAAEKREAEEEEARKAAEAAAIEARNQNELRQLELAALQAEMIENKDATESDDEVQRASPILIEDDMERVEAMFSHYDKNGNPIVEELRFEGTNKDMESHKKSRRKHKGERFHVTIVSITSLSNNGRTFDPLVKAYVKMKLREQHKRTPVVTGEGRELIFKHTTDFDVENPTSTDVLHCAVYGEEEEGDRRYGLCEIDLTRVVKGKPRDVYVPIVANAETGDAAVVGFITIRLLCKTWGRPPEACIDLTNAQQTRIRNFYMKYNPQLLHRLDFENDGAEGFDLIMAKNVRKFGPEPDTRTLRVTIVNCKELHSNGNCGYHMSLKIGKSIQETKVVTAEEPVFNESFTYIVNPKSKEHMTLVLYYDGEEYGRCLMSLRNLPPNSVKRRTVSLVSQATTVGAAVSGSCTLEFYAVDFGCNSIPSDEAENILRQRVLALLLRYAPQELHKAELMLGDNVRHEEELMTNLISRYGCVPGDARLAITVKEVRNLSKNGKMIQKGDIYVKIKTSMEKNRTRTIKNTKHPFFDETFTFDLARPEKDVLHFAVYNDDFGSDYKYGEALVSLGNVQRGAPRQITAMIVHNAGTSHATPAGYLTIVLRSDDFGCNVPIDSSNDFMWRNRLKNFFTKYCPEKLHAVEVVCSSQWDMKGYMSKMVKQYGPEPPTYDIQVTVVECRDLPDLSEDASVVITHGIDTLTTRHVRPQGNVIHFNESFRMAVTNPDQDEITFGVQKWQDRTEQGRVVLSLKNCINGVEKTTTAYLVSEPGTKNAQIIGEITLKLLTTRFGLSPSSALPDEQEKEFRRTLERVYTKHNPAELHRIEVTIGTLPTGREAQVLQSIVQRYKSDEKVPAQPVTVRIKSLQTLVKGSFTLRGSIGNKVFLRTKPIHVGGSSNPVVPLKASVHDSTAVTYLVNPATATLDLTLSSPRTMSNQDLGTVSLKLAKLHRDGFNSRLLTFFCNSVAVATVCVDIRSIGFACDAKPFADNKWALVQRDVISALSRYSPTSLPQLDTIAQEAEDLESLHGQILAKHNKEAKLTVYLEHVVVEFTSAVGKELHRRNQPIMLTASIGDAKDASPLHRGNAALPPSPKAAAGGNITSAPMSPFLAASIGILSDPFEHSSNAATPTPTAGFLYHPSNPLMRLDLARKHIEAPHLKLEIKCGSIFVGEVGMSLLPLFASVTAVGDTVNLPLIGITPGQKGQSCVGSLRLTFSYPYLQDVPRSVVQRRRSSVGGGETGGYSPQRVLRNKGYLNYYFHRTMAYLKEHDPSSAVNFHDNYYGKVLLGSDWETAAPAIHAEHLKRVGAPEGQYEDPPSLS